MADLPQGRIPNRADTLRILRGMGERTPILMLIGDDDGYGTRWLLEGQQIQPAIARYLMDTGFLADAGATQFGARLLNLTESGERFRETGLRWWQGLSFLEKVGVTLFG